MTPRVLLVDDDPNILLGYQRVLRRDFALETAASGPAALDLLAGKEPFEVVVADFNMPEMNGIEFLILVQKQWPNTVRLMLTGNAEQNTAIDAVNQGHVFRFLSKPCPSEVMISAIKAGVEQYRLITAEKELLEKTLKGSVKLLTDILAMVNPLIFFATVRQTALTRTLVNHMKLSDGPMHEMATMFSSIGKLSLPRVVLEKVSRNQELSLEESASWRSHPLAAKKLLALIPRMEGISESIASQMKEFDGGGTPADTRKGQEIPLGGRILKLILDYDALLQHGKSKTEAIIALDHDRRIYDPELLKGLKDLLEVKIPPKEAVILFLKDLEAGMTLVAPVVDQTGRTLIQAGVEISEVNLMSLKRFNDAHKIIEPLKVLPK